tara:strand:- start:9 stop:518 length:510 start_codon:yes stop_codon:yes gene_type:complete
MADTVQYAVSVTPVEEVTSGEDSVTSNIMWPGTGGSLGGSGSYDSGTHESNLGYTRSSGVITKTICSTNGTTGVVLNASSTESKGIFIKNTGFLCDGATASENLLTTPITANCCVTITVGSKIIASLGSGEAIFFPNHLGHANDLDPAEFTVKATVVEHVGVEYLVIDA